LAGFGYEALAIIALITFFAAFIHGAIGFGFPLIATPLLALITDIHTAIILTLVPTLVVNLVTIASEGDALAALHRHFSLALLALIGSAIGTLVLIAVSSDIFEALLATAIIVYLLADKITLKLTWVGRYPLLSKSFFGVAAGILGGLTNVMGPLLIIYALESGYSKKEIIQASNYCFLLGKTAQLLLFFVYGRFGFDEFSLSAIMLGAAAIALYFGVSIKKRIDEDLYMGVLRGFLLLLAILLMIKAVT
jgi:uncharacterized protein